MSSLIRNFCPKCFERKQALEKPNLKKTNKAWACVSKKKKQKKKKKKKKKSLKLHKKKKKTKKKRGKT